MEVVEEYMSDFMPLSRAQAEAAGLGSLFDRVMAEHKARPPCRCEPNVCAHCGEQSPLTHDSACPWKDPLPSEAELNDGCEKLWLEGKRP